MFLLRTTSTAASPENSRTLFGRLNRRARNHQAASEKPTKDDDKDMLFRSNRFFISAQGYEWEFFRNNFEKYFGETVIWRETIDWDSGKEGYELHVQMQRKVREKLVERMRADAQKQFEQSVNRTRDIQQRSQTIDQNPQLSAASSSNINFLPPETPRSPYTFSSRISRIQHTREPLQRRRPSRSMPVSNADHIHLQTTLWENETTQSGEWRTTLSPEQLQYYMQQNSSPIQTSPDVWESDTSAWEPWSGPSSEQLEHFINTTERVPETPRGLQVPSPLRISKSTGHLAGGNGGSLTGARITNLARRDSEDWLWPMAPGV